MNSASVIDRLRSFIETEFLPKGRSQPLQPDDDLLQEGILDSIAVFQIVNFIEQTYKMRIEDQEISVDHFRDLSAMAQLVERKARASDQV